MKKQSLVTLSIIVVILLVAGGIIFLKNFQGSTIQDTPSEAAAKWIGAHSTVYTQVGCSHCIDQENLFGSNWKYINSVDYFANPDAFAKNNITATPTWIINGQQYVGVQTIDKLKQLTGYQGQ